MVVVDGSTDKTLDFLGTYKTDQFALKFVHQENQGRSKVRNNGSQKASGQLLLFMDDDMIFEPRVLEGHLNHQLQFEESVLVGGVYVPQEFTDECMVYRRYIEKAWYGALPDYPDPMTIEHLFVTAANLSIKKDTFLRLKGFNESLTDAEDRELGLRILKAKIPVYLNKSLVGWHNEQTTWDQYFVRKHQYLEGNKELSKLQHKREAHSKKRIPLLKQVILPIIQWSCWIRWVKKNRLVWIPQSIRFRLYNLIIWTYTERVKTD